MRRIGTILSASAIAGLLLAGCSGGSDPDEGTTEDAAQTTSDDAGASGGDGAEETGAAADPDASADEVLREAGLLEGDQVVLGPTSPDDPAVQRAICDYVFGTTDEVIERSGIVGELALLDSSGYSQLGGNGDGLQCVYDVDGEDGLGILLWSQELPPIEEDDGTQIVASGQFGEHWGAVAYAPTFTGDVMDEDAAAAWLDDAATRWGGASV